MSKHVRSGRASVEVRKSGLVTRFDPISAAIVQIEKLEKKLPRILIELSITPDEIGEDGKTPAQRLEDLQQKIVAERSKISGAGTDANGSPLGRS